MPAPDEWTLTYPGASGYPGATFTWGTYASGVMHGAPPDLGSVENLTDDQQRPRADGRAFGVDYRGAPTITFDMLVLGADETATRDRITQLTTLWRADAVRNTPAAVAELSTTVAGRQRVTYGRPRRFAPADKHARQGVARVIADFACVNDCWYAPAEESLTISLVPPPSGGLVTPLAAPLSTTPPVQVPGAITVGGDLPAWPVMRIYGPVTTPAVQVTGLWTMTLDLTLAEDQWITVDTRPWARTILRRDGASFAGALTRSSPRLAHAAVPPGSYEVALRGVDVTGTAKVQFRWRKTYASL